MELISLILLAVAHYLTGRGILRLFNADDNPRITFPVSFMIGIGIASFVPFVLDLLHIPLTAGSIFSTIGVLAGLGAVLLAVQRQHLRKPQFAIPRLYDLPFLAICGLIIFISVWRCYYNPVVPRDMLSGPEVIAEYAVREHSMVNSVFQLDLVGDNNQFKPPSVTSLQVIYKLAGFPFGQVWLSILFISFIVFLYQVLTEKLHSTIAGILLLLFLAIPEMYGYTYMTLFDYSNAVFFALSCYFLFRFFEAERLSFIFLSGVIMGIAVYFRSETLVLAAMLLPALAFHIIKKKKGIAFALSAAAMFFILPLLWYWLPNGLYNNRYLPVHYDIGGLVNKHPFDIGGFMKQFTTVNETLIFSDFATELYGYFFYFCIIFTLLELVLYRRFTAEGKNWQYAVLVIFIGLPLLGFLLPLMDIMNSTKRGMFKIFPLMLIYMGNNRALTRLSERIRKWEGLTPPVTPERVVVTPPPPQQSIKKTSKK